MAKAKRRSKVAVGVVILLAVVLVAGGAIAALLVMPSKAPESLASAPEVDTAPVEYSQFDDARQVPFKPQVAEEGEVATPRPGTITTLSCEAGGKLTSGDVAGSIDSVPMVALHTDYPLYRDLVAGDKGADVSSLQAELTRLGYKPATTGAMDWATRSAIKAFLTDRGFVKPDGTVSLANVVKLPQQSVDISGCPAAVGAAVEEADALFTTGGGIQSLQMTSTPDRLTPGDRVAGYQGVFAPVDAQGRVTDPAFLEALQGMDIWQGWKLNEGEMPLTLQYALATPLNTAALPASALYAVGGGTGCVRSADGAHRVTIVSSSLGSTYVTLDDGAQPSSVSLATPSDRTDSEGAGCS